MEHAKALFFGAAQTGMEFYRDNTELCVTMGVVLVVLAIIGFTLHKGKKVPGEEAMITKEVYVTNRRVRKQHIKALMADGVADLLLDMYTKNVLNKEEYERWHMRFGTQLALKDLLPQKLTPELVKSAAKKRINNGVYKPVNIPGPPVKKDHHKSKLAEILSTAKV